MDFPTSLGLFSTKGIEYLLVIAYLLLLPPFWILLTRGIRRATKSRVAAVARQQARWFPIPKDVFVHPGHTWVRPGSNDTVELGWDAFAAKLVGNVDAFNLPRPGQTIHAGEPLCEFTVADQAFEILSPVTGTVVETNSEVTNNPVTANDDPYQTGHFARVRVANRKASLNNLINAEEANHWMDGLAQQVLTAITGSTAPVLQDGGEPIAGFAKEIGGENWQNLIRSHLKSGEAEQKG